MTATVMDHLIFLIATALIFGRLAICGEIEKLTDSINDIRLSADSLYEKNDVRMKMLKSHEEFQLNLKNVVDEIVTEENAKRTADCPECQVVSASEDKLNQCINEDDELLRAKNEFISYITCLHNETKNFDKFRDDIYNTILKVCQVYGDKMTCDTETISSLEDLKEKVNEILVSMRQRSKQLEFSLMACELFDSYEKITKDMANKDSFKECLFD